MNAVKLEQRVAKMEKELATLQAKVEQLTGTKPWWERIAGTFHNDPHYRQAMKLGRQFRKSQKLNGSKPTGKGS